MSNRVAVVLVLAGVAFGQESDVRMRKLWDTTLINERPPAPSAKGTTPAATKKPAVPAVRGLVGVTVWRLRPSRTVDRRDIRALIQEEGKETEWTPERIPADTPLIQGQRVRISIESGEEGYLYIIDRDVYADGTKSDPYLIFPTTRTRGGDNRVKAGVLIEIPAADDNPSYFKVVRSRTDQVNELLTIVVAAKPIPGIELGRDRLKLREEQVGNWEKMAQTKTYKLESKEQQGQVLTLGEQAAGRGKPHTQADPVPQTMFKVDSKPGDTLMVQLPLTLAK